MCVNTNKIKGLIKSRQPSGKKTRANLDSDSCRGENRALQLTPTVVDKKKTVSFDFDSRRDKKKPFKWASTTVDKKKMSSD